MINEIVRNNIQDQLRKLYKFKKETLQKELLKVQSEFTEYDIFEKQEDLKFMRNKVKELEIVEELRISKVFYYQAIEQLFDELEIK